MKVTPIRWIGIDLGGFEIEKCSRGINFVLYLFSVRIGWRSGHLLKISVFSNRINLAYCDLLWHGLWIKKPCSYIP